MNKKIFYIFLILIIIPFVIAQINFYSEGIYVYSVDAVIDIQDNTNINLDYILINKNNLKKKVNLSFIGVPKNANILLDNSEFNNKEIIFEQNEKKAVHISYISNIQSANNLNILNFEPNVLFNDMYNSEKIDFYNIKLILPQGVESIVSSNENYDSKTIEDERTAYHWNKEDIYPTSLSVMWSSLDVKLTVKQEANTDLITDIDQIVKITITLENNGEKEANNISLTTYLFQSDFEAVEPLKEFEQPSVINDGMLVWKKNVDLLKSGEIKTLQYSIKPKSLINELRIKSPIVKINNSLIAVSNIIKIDTKHTCGNGICEEKETYQNCPQDCKPEEIPKKPIFIYIISIILILISASIIIYFIIAKKRIKTPKQE